MPNFVLFTDRDGDPCLVNADAVILVTVAVPPKDPGGGDQPLRCFRLHTARRKRFHDVRAHDILGVMARLNGDD